MGRVSIHALIGKILQLIEHDSDGLSLGIQVTGSIIEIKADLAGGSDGRTGRTRPPRTGTGAAMIDPSEYPAAIKEALASGKPLNLKKLARKILRGASKMLLKPALDEMLASGAIRHDVRGYRLADGSSPATRRRGRPPKLSNTEEKARVVPGKPEPATTEDPASRAALDTAQLKQENPPLRHSPQRRKQFAKASKRAAKRSKAKKTAKPAQSTVSQVSPDPAPVTNVVDKAEPESAASDSVRHDGAVE